MFCQNCGKELEDNWTVCPNCGNRILPIEEEVKEPYLSVNAFGFQILPTEKEVKDGIKKDEDNFDEDTKLLKAMIREHPVRASLCIPAVLYFIYLIYQIITKSMSELTLWMFIDFCIKGTFCDTAIWLLYGPVNLREVKEKVRKKPQKGYGIASHIGSVIVAFVILAVCNYAMDEANHNNEAAGSQLTTNEAAATEAGNDMTLGEYLNQCQEVTVEELARNPEQYIGKNIKLEGRFSILADEITIGWFPENYIIKVNYDKQAVDAQGNVVGNIMTGDYGLVAGRYGGEDVVGHPYIDAEIIILDNGEEGKGDSAESKSKEENTSEEDVGAESEPETMEMEYIFPDSDSRYLTEDELIDLDSDALKLARNEIFARHGYIFKDKGLQEYFDSTTWYKGTVVGEDFDMEKEFNDFEKANVALIGSIEE